MSYGGRSPPSAFAAVSTELKAARKPAADASLFEHKATEGASAEGDDKPATAADIATKAREYIAAQAKQGFEVSVSDAVFHVTRKAA